MLCAGVGEGRSDGCWNDSGVLFQEGEMQLVTEGNPLFSIVIPFYNNKTVVPLCLPSVIEASEKSSAVGEIIMVDDCSTDGTAEWIKNNYPKIKIVTNEVNLGFGKTCLKGITLAANEWIVLLNSDVKIITDLIRPLELDVQRHPELFAVEFLSFKESGEVFEGRKTIKPKTGLWKTRNNFSTVHENGKLYDSFYACGGHCLVSRSKFLELGGFSPVYEPFYWEDVDLSYRSQKRGWPVFFDPACRVEHCHRGSIRSANSERVVATIQTRNKMLFFWKNIDSPLLWLRHCTGMLFRLLTSWIAGDFVFYAGFAGALGQLPQLFRERFKDKKKWRKSDWELFLLGRNDLTL